jgi:hypothetical protein
VKHVTLEGGIKVGIFEKPPVGINPFETLPAELLKYGFPPVPEDPRHRERYRRQFTRIRRKLTFIEPEFRVNRPRPGSGGIISGPDTFASATTSGTVVSAAPRDSIRWMQSDWVVPNVSAPTPDRGYFCGFWIGIGGPGGAVFQAGVHVNVSGTGRQMFPFWEWIEAGSGHILDITNLAVRPGDLLSVILCTAQGAGSTEGTVYFYNFTTGGHTSIAVSGPPLAAATAEWSVGFPFLWGGDASILGDYGEVFFAECEAVTNSFQLINGGTGNRINITSDGTANGAVVSESNPITDKVVQCLYLG